MTERTEREPLAQPKQLHKGHECMTKAAES